MRRLIIGVFLVLLLALPAFASNDPWFPRQWGLSHIKAPEAWAITKAPGMVIAVIDTGVDLGHPDLGGESKLIRGPDYRNSDSEPQDDEGHGTHVAGIAVASFDNNLGVAGVAPLARLMAIKVLGSDGSGRTSDVIKGIDFASSNGAHVINLSLGDFLPLEILHDPSYDEAIKRATGRGTVVVAAAGNDGYPFADPATAEFALIVGATDKSGQQAPYSNSGPGVNIWAPGGNDVSSLQFFCEQDPLIWSTYLRGEGDCSDDYDQISGTSMAAPHVAGVAAMVRSVNPSLGPVDVRNVIINTADSIDGGLKRINAAKAVNAAKGAGGGSASNSGSRAARPGSSAPGSSSQTQGPAANEAPTSASGEIASDKPASEDKSLGLEPEDEGGGLNWFLIGPALAALGVGSFFLARYLINRMVK